MNVELGQEVGYSVRFDENFSKHTKIKYVTDGMLLQEALRSPMLTQYKVVIVDEAHERSLQTDVLLGLLKRIQRQRRAGFHLIVMSATLNASAFLDFFKGSRVVYIRGRQHPVEVHYTKVAEDSYLDAALQATLQVHIEEPHGDILVFLTGQDEIESIARLMRNAASSLRATMQQVLQLDVISMYAAMPPDQQMKAFEPASPGTRKAILATNIAETSLTIPGVRYVIDTGMVKARGYSAKSGVDSLQVVPISQSQATQRSGRAGREGPGKAFRLYTEGTFFSLQPETTPEIVRTNLSSSVIKLKALGVHDLLGFDFMSPPPQAALMRSLELLYALGALNKEGCLTHPVGEQMSRLPVDPMFGRVVLASGEMGCCQEALAVISMVSTDNVFFEPRENQEEAAQRRQKFVSPWGDHLTLLHIFNHYIALEKKERMRWCRDLYINHRAMKKALSIHEQLAGCCDQLGIPMASCHDDSSPIRRSLVSGLFPHAAKRQPDRSYRLLASAQGVHLHPSSVLCAKRPEYIVFTEMVKTNRVYARQVTDVEPGWLPELVPSYFSRQEGPRTKEVGPV
eukprot:evm.model.scf_66EXC.15 EVM.evm.TU.scf_66EXC.15   scf_66EXC:132143-139773(+)